MPRRLGRPPTIGAEQVLAAAIACADDHGLAGCTMRSVAERLGVTPMALYRHVHDKDHLLALLPDALLADVATSIGHQQTGADALREVAFGIAAVLEAHPWAARLFEQPRQGPNMRAASEHCVRLLVADGASADEAFRWIRALVAQVIGESLTAHGGFDRTGVDLLLQAIPHGGRAGAAHPARTRHL
jgi:AcrR family transcriptional regulator